MDEKEITQNLIRAIMLYGIVRGWEVPRLMEEFEHFNIPGDLVDETLNEGA